MNIILLGPQGSGKGTQAELLIKKFGLQHFEAGKILRSIANSDNQHSKEVKVALNSGNLAPDELVRLIVWDFINKHKEQGSVFDGYPRSVAQYVQLKDMLARFGQKIDHAIDIEISESESVKRLSARRQCAVCGEVYNLITEPPTCDHNQLIQREDDKPEAIKKRLEIYRAQTHPVFEKAKDEGIGIEIDGERSVEIIHKDILSRLK
ncbi:MAG: nucleoside monophosphate kinase [Patescibacteria group bacterium]